MEPLRCCYGSASCWLSSNKCQTSVSSEWPLVKGQQKSLFSLASWVSWRTPQGGAANPLQYCGIRLVPVRLPVGIAYNPRKLDFFASCALTQLYALSKGHSCQFSLLTLIRPRPPRVA